MIKVVSVETMKKIETAADANGISFNTMFARVAAVTSHRIQQRLQHIAQPRITILVGSGNNGGDGLLTALELAEDERLQVGVYLVKSPGEDDEKLKALRETNVFIAEAENDQQYRVLKNMVASANLIVDAIFGIGLRLPIEGEISKILRNINQAINTTPPPPSEGILIDAQEPEANQKEGRPWVLALDCPTGINCDTGEVDKQALKADETITFIAVKQGMLQNPAAAYVGNLSVATLGIPEDLDELKAEPITFTDAATVKSSLPLREAIGHKGTYGKVMITAGSVNFTGAAGLAAYAAYRTGAGVVTVAAPMPVVSALASQLLEPTWVLLPHDMGVISEKAAEVLAEEINGYDALLIGPGLGTEDTTRDMLLKLFEETSQPTKRHDQRSIGFIRTRAKNEEKEVKEAKEANHNEEESVQLPPLVLDADGLNLLAKVEDWYTKLPPNTILTPHPGEMANLSGDISTREVQNDRIGLAKQKAADWQTIIVLKGAHTVVAAPDGRVTVLPFKTSALSTAGTGDVLAGIIVSLLGQGLAPFEAAMVGAYLHGLAGTLAARYAGSESSVIASDVLEMVGEAITELS